MEEAKEKLDSEMVSRRKEKRKALKKMKRKERRKEIAEMERLEEEARLNDPEEQKKRMLLEQQEAERIERDRIAFEEREKAWIIKQQQQAQIQLQLLQQQHDDNTDNDDVLGEEEEDEEDGPPEIIWLGNEIIIKKKKPNLLLLNHPEHHHDNNRPTSNPFPPESPSQPRPNSALPDYVAQQIPNFGTELDKAHCPFHLKTGVCRFGDRCSRVHFYPDKSCTFVIKNMYNGPGLAWEQDEGLEVCSFTIASSHIFPCKIERSSIIFTPSTYRYFFCSYEYIIIEDWEAPDFGFAYFNLNILAVLSGNIPFMA
ncbi:hypothetical protein KIW84_015919 [Lathyrus oleraceus]|uniref:C3H1-type domain-containing protein n=1 Tax=Pisum sativum TaxID=3888 RepID=A0A9D5BRW6_PEA|nr:hypothetical protein KIW84_015919 [Pisum sativum]